MPYAFIGIGQCGGAIVDAAFSDPRLFEVATPILINSATLDLQTSKYLGRAYWVGMSRDHGFIDGSKEGFEHFVSGGYGKNRLKAEEDAERHQDTIQQMIISRAKVKGEEVEGVGIPVAFLVFGMGGGTGSGAGPIVAKVLKEMNIPVIAVVVLPASHEGGLTAKNAVECLNVLTYHVDAIVLIDNEKLAYAESTETLYQRYNEYVAFSLRDIVIGTVMENITLGEFEGYAPVIDLKDMVAAASFTLGKKQLPGFACLGRASERTRDLFHYIFPFRGEKEIDVISLLYRAFSKLTVEDIRVDEAEKNLVLLRLPPSYLAKDGKINTGMAKTIMEERSRLGETHFGVALTRRNLATATILLTYRPNQVTRLRELSLLAGQYEDISLKVLEEYERDFSAGREAALEGREEGRGREREERK
jgi:cell division GTPase FtsZ